MSELSNKEKIDLFERQGKRRTFGGKLTGFKSKGEAHFQKKHLKGYLKGQKLFQYGTDIEGMPKMHVVIENWIKN